MSEKSTIITPHDTPADIPEPLKPWADENGQIDFLNPHSRLGEIADGAAHDAAIYSGDNGQSELDVPDPIAYPEPISQTGQNTRTQSPNVGLNGVRTADGTLSVTVPEQDPDVVLRSQSFSVVPDGSLLSRLSQSQATSAADSDPDRHGLGSFFDPDPAETTETRGNDQGNDQPESQLTIGSTQAAIDRFRQSLSAPSTHATDPDGNDRSDGRQGANETETQDEIRQRLNQVAARLEDIKGTVESVTEQSQIYAKYGLPYKLVKDSEGDIVVESSLPYVTPNNRYNEASKVSHVGVDKDGNELFKVTSEAVVGKQTKVYETTFTGQELLKKLEFTDGALLNGTAEISGSDEAEVREKATDGASIRQNLRQTLEGGRGSSDDLPETLVHKTVPRPTSGPSRSEKIRSGLKSLKDRYDKLKTVIHSGLVTGELAKDLTDKAKNMDKKKFAAQAAAFGVAAVAAAIIVKKTGLDQAVSDFDFNLPTLGGSEDSTQELIQPFETDTVTSQVVDALEQAEINDTAPSGPSAETFTYDVDSSKPNGVTYMFQTYLESQGVNASPEELKAAFEQAQQAGLVNEENISNLAPMDVDGGVGFVGDGKAQASPELISFLNKQFDIK